MSFRKRGEVLGGGATPQRGPQGATSLRQGSVPIRGVPASTSSSIPRRGPISKQAAATTTTPDTSILDNPAVRPSLITSQPTISTGSSDLDKILLHQGLPLGHSLLVEESGTTDFASVLLRAFASQGVIHNRIAPNQLNSHVIVLGMSPLWSNDLPGLYKGSSKEQKKAKIAENEAKVSVTNIAHGTNAVRNELKMKIAWRYGLNKKDDDKENEVRGAYEYYNNQFDITQKLQPGPNPQDISYIPLSNTVASIMSQLTSIVKLQLKTNPSKVIRLVIPGFLNPSIYAPSHITSTFVFPFVHSLRSLLRQFENNLVLICSLPLDLYPRDSSLTAILEILFDSAIHLQPFNQEMSQLIEKAYKNEPSKIQQGLVNIIKLPILSERGLMMIHDGEFAFKNGRKKFEIEEWGIPVEDDSKENETPEGGKTVKNIDF